MGKPETSKLDLTEKPPPYMLVPESIVTLSYYIRPKIGGKTHGTSIYISPAAQKPNIVTSHAKLFALWGVGGGFDSLAVLIRKRQTNC